VIKCNSQVGFYIGIITIIIVAFYINVVILKQCRHNGYIGLQFLFDYNNIYNLGMVTIVVIVLQITIDFIGLHVDYNSCIYPTHCNSFNRTTGWNGFSTPTGYNSINSPTSYNSVYRTRPTDYNICNRTTGYSSVSSTIG